MFPRCETWNIWCRRPFPDPTEFEAVMFVQTLRQRAIFSSGANVFFCLVLFFYIQQAADWVVASTNTTRMSFCKDAQNFRMKRQENNKSFETWIKNFFTKRPWSTCYVKECGRVLLPLQTTVVRTARPAYGNDASLFLLKPETKTRSPACSSSSSSSPTNDLFYLQRQPDLISYNLAVAIVSFWILATLLCSVPVWKPLRLSEIVYTAQTCVVCWALQWQPSQKRAVRRESHEKKCTDICSENNY